MDNLTHSLVGLAAAKSGLERLSPGATTLCVLAANAPDADIAVLFFGDRWSVLQHHRGITHSLIGTAVLAILLPIVFWFADIIVSKLKQRERLVRLIPLLVVSLVVTFTHPLLDWTNSYGIRPLLPWNSAWFYGDFVFIVDPFIWLILGSACFLLTSKTRFTRVVWLVLATMLTLLIIVTSRAGGVPQPWLIRAPWLAMLALLVFMKRHRLGDRLGSKIAMSALSLVVLYWGALVFAHASALSLAQVQAASIVRPDESISRLAAMPTLANAFNWDCVFETNKATYRFELRLGSNNPISSTVRYEKPSGALERALKGVSEDRRTQIFLGFARFPVARLSGEDCTTQTLVQLADLRYTEPGTSRGTFSLDLPTDCTQPLTVNR